MNVELWDDSPRGIIAFGGDARGFVAIGGCSIGVVAIGGFSIGIVAIGGGAIGLSSFGGLATKHNKSPGQAWGISNPASRAAVRSGF